MTGSNELTQNVLMHDYRVYSKKARIHESVTFLAKKRVVVYHRHSARQRFLPILPLKCDETREYLKIPEHITTEVQLWNYVKQKRRSWLNHHSRRPKQDQEEEM